MVNVGHAHFLIAAQQCAEGIARNNAVFEQISASVERQHRRTLVVDHAAAERPRDAPSQTGRYSSRAASTTSTWQMVARCLSPRQEYRQCPHSPRHRSSDSRASARCRAHSRARHGPGGQTARRALHRQKLPRTDSSPAARYRRRHLPNLVDILSDALLHLIHRRLLTNEQRAHSPLTLVLR